MATSTGQLVQSQIRLLQEGSVENNRLATFWNSKSTAIILINWRLPDQILHNQGLDYVTVEVQESHGSKEFDMREVDIYSTKLGKKELQNRHLRKSAKSTLAYNTKKELAQLFSNLSSQYDGLMIATYEAKYLLDRFKAVGFQLSRGVAVVDLMKVLNYHSTLGLDVLDNLEWGCSSPIVKVDGEWMRKYNGIRSYGENTYSRQLLESLGPVAKERAKEGDRRVRSQRAEQRLKNWSEADKRKALKWKARARVARD